MNKFNCYINSIGSKYSNLTNYEIFRIWGTFKPVNEWDRLRFREELVKRGYVSWDEINTKYDCVRIK